MSRWGAHRVWQWIPWLAVAAVTVAEATQLILQYRQEPTRVEIAPPAGPAPVDLAVEQQGGVLVVRWNPATPPVVNATHGLLNVTDGDFERKIGLAGRDLEAGVARYAPLSRYVSFQLSLFDTAPSGKGSVLFLARDQPDTSAQPPKRSTPPAAARPTIVERSRARRKQDPVAETRKPDAIKRPTLDVPPLPLAEPIREAAIAAPTPAPGYIIPEPPAPPPPPFRVTVTTLPSRGTRLEQVLNKVPFVKRIAKTPTTDELVQPVQRVDPRFSEIPDLHDPLDASVEIQVDRSGNVKEARLVDLDRAPGNAEWAALRTARLWRFEPPREGQSSWLVLKFHFEPSTGLRAE